MPKQKKAHLEAAINANGGDRKSELYNEKDNSEQQGTSINVLIQVSPIN